MRGGRGALAAWLNSNNTAGPQKKVLTSRSIRDKLTVLSVLQAVTAMGITERKQRQKQNLRREIIDASRQLFLEEGYQNVSMRKIAEKIEYSPTTIYIYFKDKAELLNTICEDVFGELQATVASISQRHSDPVEALRAGCRAYVDFGLAHPDHYKVTFMLDPGDGFHLDCQREGSMATRAFDHLRNGIQACMDAGRFPQENSDLAAQAMWSSIHGITALLITRPYFPWGDTNQVIDLVIGNMIDGFRAG